MTGKNDELILHMNQAIGTMFPGLAKRLEAALQDDGMIYPAEITQELEDVLGQMLWNTGPIAHCLRADGADIKTKAEIEQAHVLHWLTKLALQHGAEWRKFAAERLSAINAKVQERATEASIGNSHP